jgi:trans-aconitate methyltransferase
VSISALSPEAFEARYVGGRDPWAFAKDAYELGRYRTILASLQRSGYETVYEPGCSVGVLTRQLASIAKRVIATDFAPSAVEQAQRRCADQVNVEIVCADVAAFVPAAPLDLVVFSEIGYYFFPGDLSRLASRLMQCLVSGGEFIAVHWLGTSKDHLLHADQVHEVLRESFTVSLRRADWYPGFRLDSWIKS